MFKSRVQRPLGYPVAPCTTHLLGFVKTQQSSTFADTAPSTPSTVTLNTHVTMTDKRLPLLSMNIQTKNGHRSGNAATTKLST